MNVLHLGKFGPPREGGIELFTYDLLEYLNNNSIKADLLCFDNITRRGTYKNFQYYSCKTNFIINSAPFSFDYCRIFKEIKNNYDLIHIHSPNPIAEVLALSCNKNIVIHWHSDIVRQKIIYLIYKAIQKKVLKRSKIIVCTSPHYLETSVQLEGFKDKCVVIPLGLAQERLNNKSDLYNEKLFNALKNKRIVLSIGRLVKYKGFEYLIDSAKYLSEEIIICIAGAGKLYNKLQKRILKNDLQNKVILLGKVSNISFWMRKCDLFCLPSVSRNEAFGLVLVEAFYFGKPVITTNVNGSGMNFINMDGITGFVVNHEDSKAIANAINTILSNENLRKKFSQNAIERFKEFEIDKVGENIKMLYEEILSK